MSSKQEGKKTVEAKYFIASNKYSLQERQTKRGKVYDVMFRIIDPVSLVERQKKISGLATKAKAKEAYLAFVAKSCEPIKMKPVRNRDTTKRDPTIDELIHDEAYEAVFIGSGAGLPRFSGIPGEGLCGVYSANEFLTRTNLMKAYLPGSATPIRTAKRVAVIGGGNVAMDAARVAKRLGAQEVTIVYRRSEAELPARKEEYENAIEEGIQFRFLTAPIEILSDEKGFARGLLCEKMTLGAPEAGAGDEAAPAAQALTEESGALASELALDDGRRLDPWFSPQNGVGPATQLYHHGEDPCPVLHERSDWAPSREARATIAHASGATFDPSYVLPELSELKAKCPEFATRLNNELLSGSNQLFNELVLYHNLEQLGTKSIPDLNAAELRKLIADSLKSLNFVQLDEYCKLFWGLPPKREDELKDKLRKAYEVLERNLLNHLYLVAQTTNLAPLPPLQLDNAAARRQWFSAMWSKFYLKGDYREEHKTVGRILNHVSALLNAPSAVWLLTEFEPEDLSAGADVMRDLVFTTYAQYEDDIRTFLASYPLTDPKELDEVIFYAYLLADKTHLESDFDQYEALVQLSSHLTLFKMLAGAFCHKSNFESDLVNYVNRYVGKDGLSGALEPREDSDLASSILGSGSIFKTQYRNCTEFKRLLPHVYGLHFCYLDSVLQLSLNGLDGYNLPCSHLRVHLFNLTRLTNTIYIKRVGD